MIGLQQVLRVFDSKPWVAHLYVTEQCNLDCHYCNEYDNSIPHPAVAICRNGWTTSATSASPGLVSKAANRSSIRTSSSWFVMRSPSASTASACRPTVFSSPEELLADLEGAGLDQLQISVDRMTPIASTRKSMKSIVHKLDWFQNSKISLNVSGVLFKETIDEMGQVIDTCLDRGIPVHARVIHDDLVHDRALRDPKASEPLLRFIEKQEDLKRGGEKIHTSWNLFDYEKKMLRQEPVEWTCIAGYKYFFVSSRGKFWLCSQVRTERDILEITREDLLSYNGRRIARRAAVFIAPRKLRSP